MDGEALEATFTRPNGIGASPNGKELWINDLTVGPGGGRGRNVVSLRRVWLVTLSDVLGQLDADAGVEAVSAAYDAYRTSRAGESDSADAIALGYQWLTAGRIAQAIRLFQMNAESWPSDANAQFHFGEAFRYTGRPDRAAAQYRQVLELQPEHSAAAARLAEVTGGA